MEKIRSEMLRQLREKVVKCLLSGIEIIDIEVHITSEVAVALALGVPHHDITEALDAAIGEAASVA